MREYGESLPGMPESVWHGLEAIALEKAAEEAFARGDSAEGERLLIEVEEAEDNFLLDRYRELQEEGNGS